MLKSLHSLTREQLAKGGPGSGRYPKGSGGERAGGGKVTTPNLSSVDTTKLSPIESREYERLSQDHSKEEALQVIINTVEGDWSQLSEQLKSRVERDTTWKMTKGGPGSGRHPGSGDVGLKVGGTYQSEKSGLGTPTLKVRYEGQKDGNHHFTVIRGLEGVGKSGDKLVMSDEKVAQFKTRFSLR